MFKQFLSLAMIGLLSQALLGIAPVYAGSKPDKDSKFASKVKAGILKLGVGEQSLVKVKLRDKTKLAGYVTEVSDESFVVTDSKTGATTSIAYKDVSQINGNNLSRGAKIALTVGIVAVIFVLAIAFTPR